MDAAEIVRGSGLFDTHYYLLNGLDVLTAGVDPVGHFCKYGWREDRKPNPYFDPAWYLQQAPEAAESGPLAHYSTEGEARGLRPSLAFDPAWYRREYGLAEARSPLRHYLENRGLQTFSPLPLFDVHFYMQRHGRDIPAGRDPFAHYLVCGGPRDLDPSAFFDAGAYRRRHMTHPETTPELRNPLLHFIATFILGYRHAASEAVSDRPR